MTIKTIAFDADDTLWHAEILFKEAQEKLNQVLSAWCDSETLHQTLYKIETQNITRYGFGVKSFTLSMLEAALFLSDGRLTGKTIQDILQIGNAMLEADVLLIPQVKETLEILQKDYRLIVITKGDLLEQNMKISRSGLAGYFSVVEVVSNKSIQAYRNILNKLNLDPRVFIMVGNSLPSDIQPVLSLGGVGIHIPANTTWAHDLMDDFDSSQENFYELEHIGQLPNLLTEININ